MKDYVDLLALAREGAMDSDMLAAAILATCTRWRTAIPSGLPVGLTSRFAHHHGKQTQWQAFLKKHSLQAPSLVDVVGELAAFSHTPLMHAAAIRGGD